MPESERSLRRWTPFLDGMAAIAMTAASGAIIWALLTRAPAPVAPVGRAAPDSHVPADLISIDGAPVKGRPDAPLAIIEFSEFLCPYCADFARDVLPTLAREYLDTGKAFLVFRHLPLQSIHPLAETAAVAAECAARQGQFWSMHDALFKIQKQLQAASFAEQARTLGLNELSYSGCANSPPVLELVRKSALDARKIGVTGTPTFLIGRLQSNGQVKAVKRISGAQPFSAFDETLRSLGNLK